MPHDVTLIATIAVGFVLAFIFGFAAQRFRLPPLVGYLVAGMVIAAFIPSLAADRHTTDQLAEIGVMLLMFGVGLHFSIPDLMAVRGLAIPGAIVQIVLATLLGLGLAMMWGWSLGAGLVLGLCLSVASTVVLLKALEERNAVNTPNGRIAVGWLIVEDLVMVLVLVLLPAFAGLLGGHVPVAHEGDAHQRGLLLSLGITLGKVVAFVALALFLGPRVMPWLLRQVARTGSRELFTLSVLAIALGIAFGSAKIFDVSFALGAFFAGVILSESDLSHKAAANSLPLQDAFAVIFFVSVGMLFDPSIILREPLAVLAVLGVIIVGKAILALGIVLVMRYPLSTGLMAAAALAQIGEFSFILAGLGIHYGLLPKEGLSLILAGSILSITLSPFVFAASDRAMRWARGKPDVLRRFEVSGEPRFARLQSELTAAKERIEAMSAAHKTFTPQELAAKFPLFAGLTDEQRETLVLYFHPHEAQPGERIIRAGDKADAVYFISQGEVEVAVGKRRIKLGGGDFFGEMGLITGQARSADVTALDFSKFLTLSRGDFRAFVRKYPTIREEMATLATQRGALNRQWLDEDSAPAV